MSTRCARNCQDRAARGARAGCHGGDFGLQIAVTAARTARRDRSEPCIGLAAPERGMFARLKHEKGCPRTGDDAAAFRSLPLPDRLPWSAMQIACKFVAKQHVVVFGLEGAADQNVGRLAASDTRGRGIDGRNARAFLAHEGSRRAGDLVHDRDVAGEKIGKLREKKRRAQFRCQLLVEQHAQVFAAFGSLEDGRIDRLVALAAACRDHHVHGRAERLVGLDRRVVERQAGRIGAEPLPGLHLPLVAALGDLQTPVDLGQGMDDVRSETRFIENRLRAARPSVCASAPAHLRQGRRPDRCR